VNASASAPEGTEIYALSEGQAPRKLWAGKDEIVYALAAQPDGLLALSGNRGRIFKIAEDGTYADVAHLEAQQGLSLVVVPSADAARDMLIGTGNTGKVYRYGAASGKHEYSSDVLDAGALARFGRVEVEPGSIEYRLWTRSGNVEQPVRGWSDWQPLKDGAVASPAGRFLQWKAELYVGGTVGSVGVNYLPVNAAPVVDNLVVAPGARMNAQNQSGNQSQTVNIAFPAPAQNTFVVLDSTANAPLQAIKDRTAVTVRWATHDDNGDDLTFALYLRGDGEHVWRLLKEGITDKAYSFDATQIPDGGYQVKVVASDAPSHTPGDAFTGSRESERFEVDTTPPVITKLKANRAKAAVTPPGAQNSGDDKLHVTFDAEDASSPIVRAEYSLDAAPWQFVEPVNKLSDAQHEQYDFTLPLISGSTAASEHLVTVRVYDRHDNVGVAKTVLVPQAK
jgi:hypothetical protein